MPLRKSDKTPSHFNPRPDPHRLYVAIDSFIGLDVIVSGTRLRGDSDVVRVHWEHFVPANLDDRELAAASNEFAARISLDAQTRRERDEAARARDAEKRDEEAGMENPWASAPPLIGPR